MNQLVTMSVTGGELDRATVSSSSITAADTWLTSSRDGCYGRQILKPNSSTCPQSSVRNAGQEINCRVPRWPGIDTLIGAYQRYVHGNLRRRLHRFDSCTYKLYGKLTTNLPHIEPMEFEPNKFDAMFWIYWEGST